MPDIAFAGAFSSEDGVFKALALGAPFVKAVCMGRALMIPGMVGKNIGLWLKEGKLPATVSQFGSTVEEIFVNYEDVKNIVGSEGNQEHPARRYRHLQLQRKDKGGTPAADGRRALFQRPRHFPQRPDEPDRENAPMSPAYLT